MAARHWLGALALLSCLWTPAFAQATAPNWAALSAPEQALLGPALKNHPETFDTLPAAKREQLLKGARNWLAMNPEQRQQAAQALAEWQALSPKEREAALARRKAFRSLPKAEQQALIERQRAFAKLSAAKQQAERERFEAEQQRKQLDELRQLPMRPELAPLGGPGLPGGLRPR